MRTRRVWVGTGWKMNHLRSDAEGYARTIRGLETRLEVFVVSPFTVLYRVCELLRGSRVKVGAQNMHWEERGAFTGEISPPMVKDCGAQLVELGHSERRAEFGETDFTVNKKVLSALRHGLRPLICVGETAQEKEWGVAGEYVARQVKIALHGVGQRDIAQVILAYEPVWAIGERGTPAAPTYASAIHGLMRRTISELYGTAAAACVPILYGGSVNASNAVPFVQQPDVDGLFIGRAAWDAASFIQLIKMVEQVTPEED